MASLLVCDRKWSDLGLFRVPFLIILITVIQSLPLKCVCCINIHPMLQITLFYQYCNRPNYVAAHLCYLYGCFILRLHSFKVHTDISSPGHLRTSQGWLHLNTDNCNVITYNTITPYYLVFIKPISHACNSGSGEKFYITCWNSRKGDWFHTLKWSDSPSQITQLHEMYHVITITQLHMGLQSIKGSVKVRGTSFPWQRRVKLNMKMLKSWGQAKKGAE